MKCGSPKFTLHTKADPDICCLRVHAVDYLASARVEGLERSVWGKS